MWFNRPQHRGDRLHHLHALSVLDVELQQTQGGEIFHYDSDLHILFFPVFASLQFN